MAVEYEHSERVKRIAETLIEENHQHLKGATIVYVMKKAPPNSKGPKGPSRSGKYPTMATARSLGALLWHVTGIDFILEVREQWWDILNLDQQLALIDHELSHMAKDDDGFYIKDHDITEFVEVVRRHGPWHARIYSFIEAAQMKLPYQQESEGAPQAEGTVH